MIFTIYLLRNIDNNKIYIGQTQSTVHKRMGKNGNGYRNCPYIYRAIKKHHPERFIYEILTICEDKIMADFLEVSAIHLYNSRNKKIGYNIMPGGLPKKIPAQVIKKRAKSRITHKDKEPGIIKAYQDGYTIVKICEIFEIKSSKLYRTLKRHKIPLSNNFSKWTGRKHTTETKVKIGNSKLIGSVEEKEIIQAYQNNQQTIKQIVKDFERSTATIYRILRRNKIGFKLNPTP